MRSEFAEFVDKHFGSQDLADYHLASVNQRAAQVMRDGQVRSSAEGVRAANAFLGIWFGAYTRTEQMLLDQVPYE